jgi:hypothetical protein
MVFSKCNDRVNSALLSGRNITVADVTEASPTGGSGAGSGAPACLPPHVGERRRPGRIDPVSPQLLALLRGQSGASLVVRHATSDDPSEDRDTPGGLNEACRTARGIILAIPLGSAMWVVLALTARWALNF